MTIHDELTVLYVLWALPKGAQDRIEEQPMTSMPLTREQAKRVQRAASADGWHGFRLVPETNEVPDFTKTLNV